MCRKRPGPRCSNSATRRINSARRNLQVKIAGYERNPNLANTVSLHNAQLRLEAAQKVWFATPKGQEEIAHELDQLGTQLREALDSHRTREVRRRRAHLRTQIALTQDTLDSAVASRKNSYADLKLAGQERADLRQEALRRGGEQAPNGHPYSPERLASIELDPASSLMLEEWDDEHVARAHTWVEPGSETQYEGNAVFRPPLLAADSDGMDVPVGERIRDIPAQSRLVRLNTPDGNVVEARHDVFITRVSADEYQTVSRLSISSSWEDASPIDVTQRQVGSLLGNQLDNNVSSSRDAFIVGTYSSLDAAFEGREDAKKVDLPQIAAKIGRANLVARANVRSRALQVRGNRDIWFRYRTQLPL